MNWTTSTRPQGLDWLLESQSPGVHYLAMRDLLSLPAEHPGLAAARDAAYSDGPMGEILARMQPEGYWERPGAGYNPKYRSTVWAVILLAQLGAEAGADERVERACRYVLDHALTAGGQFTSSAGPGGTIDCLQGNLCWALAAMGCQDDRLGLAFEWMARTVTGEGLASPQDKQAGRRYYAYKCGPNFACGANNRLPCAWGAVKVMLAFGAAPREYRTPLVERAVQQGIAFLLGIDPVGARYPTGYSDQPSGNWWKFGFPVFYITDLLQLAEAMVNLGYGQDPRLANTLALIREKQDGQGRWLQEYAYGSKTWSDFGVKGKPNPWVTLRALRVLRDYEEPLR